MQLSKFLAISVVQLQVLTHQCCLRICRCSKKIDSLLTVENKRISTYVLWTYSRNVFVYLLFARRVSPRFVLQISLDGLSKETRVLFARLVFILAVGIQVNDKLFPSALLSDNYFSILVKLLSRGWINKKTTRRGNPSEHLFNSEYLKNFQTDPINITKAEQRNFLWKYIQQKMRSFWHFQVLKHFALNYELRPFWEMPSLRTFCFWDNTFAP